MFNPMAERLFDCPAADALGTSLSRFVPERFRAGHEGHVRQFGVTGVSDRQMGGRRILYGLRATGSEFPFEASISQFGDENGKLYTVMLRDISAQIDAERSLQRSHEELRELSANLLNIREEEKSRIARELHDDLGQQLTALKMDISSLELERRNQRRRACAIARHAAPDRRNRRLDAPDRRRSAPRDARRPGPGSGYRLAGDRLYEPLRY